MKRCRQVLVLLLACALLVVAGRALVADQRGARRSAGRSDRDAAAEASTPGSDIVLAGEQAKQSLVRAVFVESLGASTVDLVALLGVAFLVAVALVLAPARHRGWPAVLRRGPPLAFVG